MAAFGPVAWSDPPYKKWTAVRAAAERNGDAGQAPGIGKMVGIPVPGLPSNLTNALRVLKDGTVVYATNYGLGIGRARGQNWVCWQGLSKEPYENYIRGLAIDPAGGLWLATVHKGLARFDMATGRLAGFQKPVLPDNYVFDVAVTPDGRVWAGTYGGGLAFPGVTGSAATAVPASVAEPVSKDASEAKDKAEAALPAPALPPTLDGLNAMLATLAKLPIVSPEKQPAVIRLDDDWATKGDCLGRYGRYWGMWCSICAPGNYQWGAGPEKVQYGATIGPRCDSGDLLRHWIHWLYTQNPNSLEMPPVFQSSRVMKGYTTPELTRRQAEWDDHGETYPMSKEGPGLYCVLKIPAGLYMLSLYDFNKDGHEVSNRYRDFSLSVRPLGDRDPLDMSGFSREPELARGRIRDFWGGAYKRFLVRGPTRITIEVNRNHSFCTILAGIFVDLVDEEPVPYFHTLDQWQALCTARDETIQRLQTEPAAERARRFVSRATVAEASQAIFEELANLRLTNTALWAETGPLYYRAVLWHTLATLQGSTPEGRPHLQARAASCYYQLGLYEKWEAGQVALGKMPARQIEKSLKWDGVHDFGGKGYETVVDFLRGSARRDGDSESGQQ
jgi:hypothetical protein